VETKVVYRCWFHTAAFGLKHVAGPPKMQDNSLESDKVGTHAPVSAPVSPNTSWPVAFLEQKAKRPGKACPTDGSRIHDERKSLVIYEHRGDDNSS